MTLPRAGVQLEDLWVSGDSNGCYPDDQRSVRGTTYLKPVICAPGGAVIEASGQFDLGTHYSTFTGMVGVSDQAPSDTLTHVTITVDGVSVFDQDLRLGDSYPLSFAVAGALRLAITTVRQGPQGTIVFDGSVVP